MIYRLNIHKIEQNCLFELTWSKGQRLTAGLVCPASLSGLYDAWRRAYLGYYKQALRGRVAAAGQVVSVEVDWHSQLAQAEARLLSEFHTWLKQGELFDLRAELLAFSQPTATGSSAAKPELFLTCSSLDIARLPWEIWEFGQHIQIVRSPPTIRAATVDRQSFRRGKVRVLAILGDETGLNFAGERTALNAQKTLLEIHYVGWQPDEEIAALKQRICQTIADPQGWDILFFAGHSNEAALVDGQVAIAPNTALSIKDLSPYLRQAQQRGLQFALFNSCSGLDIANGLINLGLSQVAVMREPIHNEVAQTFLVQLLQRLACYQDVQEALLGACQFLKLEQNLTYPSAYLVPSLFRHPESVPYRLQPRGWRTTLRRWLPTRREAMAVGALAIVSLVPPVQHWLLNQRTGVQAWYRDVTGQLASGDRDLVTPPVVLVQIDDRTLQERQIAVPNPIDRTLLADLVTTLTDLEANVIALDYVLDRPQPAADPALRQALEEAVSQQSWLVLATKRSHLGEWLGAAASVASPNWSLQGDIWSPDWQIRPRGWSSQRPLPFSYQAAIAQRLAGSPTAPRPGLESNQLLQSLVASYEAELGTQTPLLPRQAVLHPVTNWVYPLRQRWLQPLIDYSIPPDRVYHRVPAWQLLQNPEQVSQTLGVSTLQNRVVMVAPGGYDEAGFTEGGEDNTMQPRAIAYWYRQSGQANAPQGFTGGEQNAYMTHQFLSDHLVVPIPDLWMVLVAALVGKGLTLYLTTTPLRSGQFGWVLAGATGVYGLVSLQIYVSGGVLLPWLLPSLTLWSYGVQLMPKLNHK